MKQLYILLLCLGLDNFTFGQGLNCSNASIIGNTEYDTQNIAGSSGRLIYEWPNGNMAAVWMIANDNMSSFDRGTGYNFYNGLSWGAIPTTRLESVRTGFPNISAVNGSGELIFSHESSGSMAAIHQLSRNTSGTGPWLEASISPMNMLWPRFATGGINNSTIHLLGSTEVIFCAKYSLHYWRSTDNGLTWDLQNIQIPQIDSTHSRMIRPAKNIVCRGNTVAFVTGGFSDNLILTKSLDNGLSWTSTIINEFPIPLYDFETMMTDVNNDGIADSVVTVDNAATLVIDDNNIVHVWAGKTAVMDMDSFGLLGYYPAVDGLVYWNETMGPNTILNNVIAHLEDLNNDGLINFPMLTSGDCYAAATSMASAGINDWNHLFVTYSGILEDTTSLTPSQNYGMRNIYILKSTDNGLTWSVPFRVCPDETVFQKFPSMASHVYNDPKILFFNDPDANNPFSHNIDVVYMSPDISTGLETMQTNVMSLNAWQPGFENNLLVEINNFENSRKGCIEVIDLTGRILNTHQFTTRDNSFKEKISMASFNTGFYFVVLNSEAGSSVQKVYFQEVE